MLPAAVWIPILVAAGAVWLLGTVAIIRRWRGPYGPPISMQAWTKAGRLRTNRSYEKHGWAKPYDDDGNYMPEDQREVPPGR